MTHAAEHINPRLGSIYLPQLHLLGAQAFPVPFGVAARLDGPIASGWFWGFALGGDCLVTTMHLVSHCAFTLVEEPEVDYCVLGLLSGSDTGLVNLMREQRKATDPSDPFSGGFSPTLPRNALAFSMQAGRRAFAMSRGSLHDSTNICMLPSFVQRLQAELPEGAPDLAAAFAAGSELNASPQLLEALHAIDPGSLARPGAPLHYRSLVYAALGEMASLLGEERKPATIESQGIADAVDAALVASLAAPPTLDELAARFFMGRTQLCQRFRAETGVSIGERLAELRVAEAKRRLAHGDESVAAIAQALGYAHTSSFSAMFARHAGCSPVAWRAAHGA